MPKFTIYNSTSLSFAPVENRIKNVYSLRKQTGKTSDQLRTPSLLVQQFTDAPVYNSALTPLFVQAFAPSLYTPKINQFNLLYSQLYPQSTAPINMKKKENLERNT